MIDIELGARVAVTANNGTYLGLGTYICDITGSDSSPKLQDILLDTGVCILHKTQCMLVQPHLEHLMPRISHIIKHSLLLCAQKGNRLAWCGVLLPAGTKLSMTRFEKWDVEREGEQLAVPVKHDGRNLYLLVEYIDFPMYGEKT